MLILAFQISKEPMLLEQCHVKYFLHLYLINFVFLVEREEVKTAEVCYNILIPERSE